MHEANQETSRNQPPKNGRPGARSARWRRRLAGLAYAMMLSLAAVRGAGVDAPALSEAQIKALFLFKFTQYVEWPGDAFASPTAPLIIGLIGGAELVEPLRRLVAGKAVNGRSIVIKEQITAEKATHCHILYFDRARQDDQAAFLPALRGHPVLAVGEHEKFTRAGGIVNLGRRDDKVRLEINQALAGESRLKLSSKLLGAADLVQHKP